jgi:hypothetical protein
MADIVEYLKRAALDGCDCTSCTQEREWIAEIEQLRAKLRLIAFSNFDPIDGTRSGNVMLTVEEMRAIRELAGAAPHTNGDRDAD